MTQDQNEQDAATSEASAPPGIEQDRALRHQTVAKRSRAYDVAKLVLLALVTIAVFIILGVVLLTQNTLRNNSALNRANLVRLVDCTTPGHPCYDDSAKRTGTAIANINDVTVAAAHCARTAPANVTEVELRTCIDREIKNRK